MSLRKPAVILACAAIAIVLLVSMGSLGPEPIESQSSFAQPETFTIKPEVTKFTEVSAVLEPSSTQLEPTASVMDVGLDKLSLFLNPAFAISSTQTDLSYTAYTVPSPSNGGYYSSAELWHVCSNHVYVSVHYQNDKKIAHIDTTTGVHTTWDVGEIGTPAQMDCDNSGNAYFRFSDLTPSLAKLDTQTNTLDWYDFDNTVVGNVYHMMMGPNNELYFLIGTNSDDGGIGKFNFNTDTFTKYTLTNAPCENPMAFDSSGNLYALGNPGFVCKINFSSNTVTTWDLRSLVTSGLGINYFDIDQNNNIFVSLQTHQKIAKVDQSSNLVTVWLVPEINSGPYDVTVDSSNNVFFQSSGYLWRLAPATDTFTTWNGFTITSLEMDGNTLWGFEHNKAWKLT